MRVCTALVLVGSLGLAGCALPPESRPAPKTVAECRAQYDAARARTRSSAPYARTGAERVGASLGKGIALGIFESRYKNCLASIGVAPSGIIPAGQPLPAPRQSRATPVYRHPAPAPTPAPARHCVLEMVGGSGYACR